MSLSDIEKQVRALIASVQAQAHTMHPLQAAILENDLQNIAHAIGAKDTFVSLGSTYFLMWEYSITNAKKQVRAIATNRGSKSGMGFSVNRALLEIQEQAITRGVKIERVFPIKEEEYKNFHFMEILRSQLEVGIDTWVVHEKTKEYVTAYQEFDKENYVIIDDKILYRSYVEKGNPKNMVSFEKDLIKKYIDMYEVLRSHSYQFTDNDLPKRFEDL